MSLASRRTASVVLPMNNRRYGLRFFTTFFGAVVLYASLYLAAAFLIDPRDDFGTGVIPPVVLDSREQKMRLFTKFHDSQAVGGLVLGSSRSMKLQPALLRELWQQPFFNFAVENARAEDYLAIYRWARSHGAHPKVVIIGLDIEALHNDNLFDDRLKRNDRLMQALEQPQQASRMGSRSGWQRARKVKDCFTLAYTKNMLTAVAVNVRHERPLPLMTFHADGYLSYTRYEDQQRRGTFDLDGALALSVEEYQRRLKTMTAVSDQRWEYLETLVSEVRGDGGRVVIWVTNLHPRVTRELQSTTAYRSLLGEINARLQQLAAPSAVTVFDLSDPARYGGDVADWYDGAHVGEKNARHIAQMLAGRSR